MPTCRASQTVPEQGQVVHHDCQSAGKRPEAGDCRPEAPRRLALRSGAEPCAGLMDQDLADALRRLACNPFPGTYRSTCPACSHTRSKKHDRCLSLTIEPTKIQASCWHCG